MQPQRDAPRFPYALAGAWAGALLVAVAVIAIHSSYDAQALAGGSRLRMDDVLAFIGGGAFVGFLVGLIAGARTR